jgi:hypothetical protein
MEGERMFSAPQTFAEIILVEDEARDIDRIIRCKPSWRTGFEPLGRVRLWCDKWEVPWAASPHSPTEFSLSFGFSEIDIGKYGRFCHRWFFPAELSHEYLAPWSFDELRRKGGW